MKQISYIFFLGRNEALFGAKLRPSLLCVLRSRSQSKWGVRTSSWCCDLRVCYSLGRASFSLCFVLRCVSSRAASAQKDPPLPSVLHAPAAGSGTSSTTSAPPCPGDKKGGCYCYGPMPPLPASHAELRPGEVAFLSPDEISGVKSLWAEFRGGVVGGGIGFVEGGIWK